MVARTIWGFLFCFFDSERGYKGKKTNSGILIPLLEWYCLKICLILSGQPEHLLSLFVLPYTITGNRQSGGNSGMILPEIVTVWASCQRPPHSSSLSGFWLSPPNAGGIWRWSWSSRGPWRGRFWLSLTSMGDFWIHWQMQHGGPLTSRTLSQNMTPLCFSELYPHQSVSGIMKSKKKRSPDIFRHMPVSFSLDWRPAAETRNHACIQQSVPACSASITFMVQNQGPYVPERLRGASLVVKRRDNSIG